MTLGLADLDELLALYQGVGGEYFWNFGQWHYLMIGSVGVTACLNFNRWLSVLGIWEVENGCRACKAQCVKLDMVLS